MMYYHQVVSISRISTEVKSSVPHNIIIGGSLGGGVLLLTVCIFVSVLFVVIRNRKRKAKDRVEVMKQKCKLILSFYI